MSRFCLAVVLLLPLAASAAHKKKPEVEIWPPPAEGTDQAGSELPPKPPEKHEPVDAGDPYQMDPSLLHSGTGARGGPTPPKPAPEDTCDDGLASCREDCSVEHATDDTLHVQPGKMLPITRCLKRCQHHYDTCEERRDLNLNGD